MCNRLASIILIFLTVIGLSLSGVHPALAVSRIKDIAQFEGVRENQLVGYGLVVGLNGTGDTLRNAAFTRQSLMAMLERLGVNTRDSQLQTDNVAAVMVTTMSNGSLAAFSPPKPVFYPVRCTQLALKTRSLRTVVSIRTPLRMRVFATYPTLHLILSTLVLVKLVVSNNFRLLANTTVLPTTVSR